MNARRTITLWIGLGVLVAAAPLFAGQRFWLTFAMQVWVLAAYAYSFQLLLGVCGMLSFGHAVFFGLGGFAAAHLMNAGPALGGWYPAEAVPVVGALGGAAAAIVFGYPATRRAGTPFSMVTLGIGELVAACFLMFPGFFGGESGITADRAALPGLLVPNYGPAIRLYWLILGWSGVLIALALAVRFTSLGLLARAVKANAPRLAYLGLDAAAIRFRVMLIGGILAGAAGALAAMLNEIVAVDSVGLGMSANALLMTVVGGPAGLAGPGVGALVLSFMQSVLSRLTPHWVFFYGALFLAVVLFAPAGLAGAGAAFLRWIKARRRTEDGIA